MKRVANDQMTQGTYAVSYTHLVFEKTVELSSLTKAAQELGLTQSGVSHMPVSYTHLDVYKRQDRLCR